MNWLDLVIIAIFLAAVILEAKRGFGRALFDFAALLVVVWGMSYIELLWRAVELSSVQQAAVYAGAFILIGGLLIAIGRLAYQSTLISVPPFDIVLGCLMGIGVAIVVCYGVVHVLALSAGPKDLPAMITCSALGREFITFDTYHHVVYVLQHFDSMKRPDPS